MRLLLKILAISNAFEWLDYDKHKMQAITDEKVWADISID
jgi:hypothetical protein